MGRVIEMLQAYSMRRPTQGRLRAQIDLNARTSDGLTPVPLDLVSSGIEPGLLVEVFEPEDEVVGIGQIERIDRAAGLAYLRVNWSSIRDANEVDFVARTLLVTVRYGIRHTGSAAMYGRPWALRQKVVSV